MKAVDRKLLRDLCVLGHAPSEKTHHATMLSGLIEDELKARNGRREAGHHDPSLRGSEDRFEPVDLVQLRKRDYLQDLMKDFNEMLNLLEQKGAIVIKDRHLANETVAAG